MASFIRLKSAFRPGQSVGVNLDLVKTITRKPAVGEAPERTELWFGGYGDDAEAASVVETVDQIIALIVAR